MRYITASEIGLVRDENQDYLAIEEKDDVIFAVVADGIGGANAGSLASKMTVQQLMKSFLEHDDFSDLQAINAWFHDAVTKTNERVYKKSRSNRKYYGMGTTLVALVLGQDGGVAFNIGDSRIYAYYKEKLECLSRDQTYAYEMYLKDEITFEEIKTHPKRNVLMNAVGIDRKIMYQIIHIPEKWQQLLISSDGLHSYVEHEKLLEILKEPSLKEKRQRLLEEAYRAGGYDNVSFILIEADHNG